MKSRNLKSWTYRNRETTFKEDFFPRVGNEGEFELIDEVVTRDRVSWTVNTFAPYKYPIPVEVFPAML